jgi:hypothetical protein
VLALTLGLHWTVLQSVAWVGMLVNYTVDSSFGEAVVKTFDGKHPCKLCVAVAEGRESEQNGKLLKIQSRTEGILVVPMFALTRPPSVTIDPETFVRPDTLLFPPPTPPPRILPG